MTGTETAIWFGVMAVGLIGSALYSGLETGSYAINRVRLQVLDHQNDSAAGVLRRLLAKPAMLLSTLLIGNNVANYMGTASLTLLLERKWEFDEWQIVLLNVLIITPLLFVFGETLPKDLFGAYADKLMYRFARFLQVSRIAFTVTGLVPLVGAFHAVVTRLFGGDRDSGAAHPRRQFEALVKEGVGQGLLTDEQSAIVERVMRLSGRRVEHEMVPWSQVKTVQARDDAKLLWEMASETTASRLPATNDDGDIEGVVNLYEVFRHTPENCPPMEDLIRPALKIDADTPLRVALGTLQRADNAIAVVMRDDRAVGVVTVKDLVEPITGELENW